MDQTNKVKNANSKILVIVLATFHDFFSEDQKIKKVFSSKISTNFGFRPEILAIFHEFLSEDQKQRSSTQNFYEIQCDSTKITKIQAVNTNLGVLGLDLHSNGPEPVNFFGAQPSLVGAQFLFGGHKQSFGGAQPRNAPPWRQA